MHDQLSWLSFMAFNFLYAPSVKFLEQYHIVIGATYVLLTVLPLHGMIRMLLRRFQKKTVIDLKNSTPAQTGVVATIKGAISVVSIQGPYFTPLLMATETIEIALQTWQAYRISKYISNLQINVLYGIGIFVSCWSTAVIHYVWEHKRRHPLMARFMSVLVDTMLDFLWGVVFQGVLIWKYWSVGRTVSAVSVLQEVPENADRELRQILVVSFSNFCPTLDK
ncbi:TPA: hypothetical protein N0F65_011178 [Lagenidium giganteum]|uniref:Uncharacterized protein n=1 Tax=Lagenidium giganteum TaxID=4803 RepID=A0AAV2Z428_9STRA|nr:TPA: hypothetical protein N0F65_011178 [Lagenidium giganteum]